MRTLIKWLKILWEVLQNPVPMELEYIPPLKDYNPKPMPEPIVVVTLPQRLYNSAVALLNTDASPKDYAPDEYGCVESFCEVYKHAFGTYPDGTTAMPDLSTIVINKVFRAHKERFKPTLDFKAGNIIISVTGTGSGAISNGHIGICGENEQIISNNSNTGKWSLGFTFKTWVGRYRTKGGMQVFLFEVI